MGPNFVVYLVLKEPTVGEVEVLLGGGGRATDAAEVSGCLWKPFAR